MDRKALSCTVLLALLVTGVLSSFWLVLPSGASMGSDPPEIEWERWYGGAGTDWCRSVQQTSDGGYILAGHTLSFGSGGEFDKRDFWLVKTSSSGAVQWNRTFGEKDSTETAYSVRQTRDGGYIVAGGGCALDGQGQPLSSTYDSDAWLVKTSSTGATEWIRSYNYWQDRQYGGYNDWARSVLQTSDGGYVFAGITGLVVPRSSEFWLVKTNAAGVMEWNQTYGGISYDEAYCVQQTRDGGYILAGVSTNPWDFLLVKANATGSMEWSQTYGGAGNEEAYFVRQTLDGGYIVTGSKLDGNGQPYEDWVVKTNSTGAIQWSKTYGGKIDRLDSVLQTSDGGFLFAGSGAGGWLVKTSATGQVEWNQTCSSIVLSMEKTRDGGYIVGGYGGSWPGDFYLMKLRGNDADEDGLLDNWEKYGIDSNDDGIVDLELEDADWQHKDLFVEVDYMSAHHKPDSDAMNEVVAAFANAPIDNPDNLPGIKLHVDIDDQIPHQDAIRTWTDFDSIKNSSFGTAVQRSSVNSSRILDAKKLAYRYCVFAHQYSINKTGAWIATNSSGYAELPGNDFIVTLGTFTYGWGTRDEQAATFMHELGHNLNLRHGGGDDINFKPNYLSIMNYAFQFEDDPIPERPLEFSRRALPFLYEGSLDEPYGIQASSEELDLWGFTVWNSSKNNYAINWVNAPLDWNGNGNSSEWFVRGNINNFPGWDYSSVPDEILEGYNDWVNVKLPFGDTEEFLDGVHLHTSGEEITSDVVQAIRQSRMAMHEVCVHNVSSTSPIWSPGSALSVSFVLGNLGGSDENVNVTVYANTTTVASSTLVVKAGNLTKFTLPYTGQALIPGTYTLKATVSQIAGETYTADNTVTGGTITVTDVIPEFSPVTILTTALILAGVAAAARNLNKK